MSTAQDLESVEISIEEAKKKIERMQMLMRLQNNQDFKALIEKGFLESHAVRQVMLKSHPGLQNEATQKLIDDQITAIGQFQQFLISVYTEGRNAEASMAADEQTREELLKEDLDNE